MPTITLTQLVCAKCQHAWIPRSATPPQQCPKCKSLKWATPKKAVRHV